MISNIINPQSTASRPQILDDVPSAELLIEDLGRPPVTPPSLEPPIATCTKFVRTPELAFLLTNINRKKVFELKKLALD
jgi:hypothetical protein